MQKKYSIYRFKKDTELPNWIYSSDFYSIAQTKDELSVIATQTNFDLEGIIKSEDWRIFKIVGPLDLSLIGIISEVSRIFNETKISIFKISTYDTDYILVKQKNLNSGIEALREKGHKVSIEN
ncbi:MAG: ACT domain-containing protein [Clostridiales bacterium]|nr:ACT domain-containing protein [Clostridiales bacterium]